MADASLPHENQSRSAGRLSAIILQGPLALLRAAARIPLFWWDPETRVERWPHHRSFLPALLLLALLLYATGILHLTCWTPRFHSVPMMGLLLGGFLAIGLARRQWPRAREAIGLYGSMTLALAAFPLAFAFTCATLLPYALVMRTSAGKLVKWLTLAGLHAAMMVLFHLKLFPSIVFNEPLRTAGLIWALFVPLRLLWFHHQALRQNAPAVTVKEVFHYIFFAPAVILVPYMFALPRREELSSDRTEDPALRSRGENHLAAGMLFALSYHLLDPAIAWTADVTGARWLLIPWAYPLEPVFWALSSSYFITGLYNCLGMPVTLAFRSPLKSHSVLEWWRRWNVHFRDLLVDMFFYPLVLGRRSRPYLRLWMGAFGVFLVGSVILHYIVKHYFLYNAFVPYWSIVVEMGVLFVAVGLLLHLERRDLDRRTAQRKAARAAGLPAPPPPANPAWRLALGVPLTYGLLFASNMLGASMNLIVHGTLVDRPTVALQHAEQLERNDKPGKAAWFRNQARLDFERAVARHGDLTSPWRVRERHAAFKLLRLYVEDKNTPGIRELLKKLDWDPDLAKNPEKLDDACRHELTRFRGLSGFSRLRSL